MSHHQKRLISCFISTVSKKIEPFHQMTTVYLPPIALVSTGADFQQMDQSDSLLIASTLSALQNSMNTYLSHIRQNIISFKC